MIPYTALGGTHDWLRGQWFYCDSPFAAFMRTEGFICQRPNHPLWSTAAGGVPGQKRRIWRFGGEVTLANYLRSIPVGDRRILSVSHGGQVVDRNREGVRSRAPRWTQLWHCSPHRAIQAGRTTW